MSVESLNLELRIVSACLAKQYTDCKKILLTPDLDLLHKLGLSEDDVKTLKKAVRESFAKHIIVCNDFKHSTLSTGCKVIDSNLEGGFLYPGINEVCGESASGKTQLCIQLCLNVKKSISKQAGSLYVCTEDVFPTKRLQQMAQHFYQQHKTSMNINGVKGLMDDIFIEHISELDDLWSLLDVRLPALLAKSNIKLLIIDSVAAIFRSEFSMQEMAERARMLAKLGNSLQKISHYHDVCIVCVNQVSDKFDGSSSSVNPDGSRRVVAALGPTWSYVVNTRIMLSRTKYTLPKEHTSNVERVDQNVLSTDIVIRTLKVEFAPHLPPSQCFFFVDGDGVKDYIPDEKMKSVMES